jgi:hypothetical protein
MRAILRQGLGVFLAVVSGATAQAATVVMDFNAATGGGTTPYTEDGFTLTVISGHYDIWPNGGVGNSRYLGIDRLNGVGSSVQIARTSGNFDLMSLWVKYTPFSGFGEYQTIFSSAGGVMSLDTAGVQAFGGTAWQNLSWIRLSTNIEIGGPGYDDITFNTLAAVPIPAAYALFASALGCLGLLRRRAEKLPS